MMDSTGHVPGRYDFNYFGAAVMQIPVLIEHLPDRGFRARSGEPLVLTGEGTSRDEALQNLKSQIRDRMTAGAEFVAVEVPPVEHPWAPFAGMLDENVPLVQEWQENMAERRRDDGQGVRPHAGTA
jgi:hypothetical protein